MLARMLRPVPSRPPGPVDPAEAARHVTARLPALDAPAVAALSIVALVGGDRAQAGAQSGLAGEELAVALARGRKELRRALQPLPGSGWCERAERLLSDRLDDALDERGHARLDVHLANCERCVDHERRLGQAQNALVAGYMTDRRAGEPLPPRRSCGWWSPSPTPRWLPSPRCPASSGGVAVAAPLALTALLTAIIALAMLFAGAF